MLYLPSLLENKIAKTYKEKQILQPHEINPEEICEFYDIFYCEKPIHSHYIILQGIKVIVIDSRLNEYEKREQFFHELGHIIFHEGLQTSLTKDAHYFQEVEANRFCKYALIPFHMLCFINFNSEYIVEEMSDAFCVSRSIATERLLDIKNKITMSKV